MKGGGNITDISQIDGIKLISSYWSRVKGENTTQSKYAFVGDVHGDLHQFLAPLVLNKVITLTGEVETKDEKIMHYVPKYDIVNSVCKVIYLGDIADEWIFSRSISSILYDLLKKKLIIYIYGNHDLSIIGRYHLFKQRKLNIAEDIPPLWETIKKELNCIKNVKIYKDKILYDNDEDKGLNFLYEYLDPLFENLYKIFSERLGKLSLAININKVPLIVSHCTWSKNAIKQLLQKSKISSESQRQSDKQESQLSKVIENYEPSEESINYLSKLVFGDDGGKNNGKNSDDNDGKNNSAGGDDKNGASDDDKNNGNNNDDSKNNNGEKHARYPLEKLTLDDYVKLSNACNDVFNSKSRLFISKNNITYSRNIENIFVNQITGHSIGSEWREIGVNIKQSTFNNERIEKLKPEIINGCRIYYFDFGSSPGYEHDEISRPDYVYVNDAGMYVTNLPAFSFIISNNSSRKDSLLVMKDKTPRSRNKIVWNKMVYDTYIVLH